PRQGLLGGRRRARRRGGGRSPAAADQAGRRRAPAFQHQSGLGVPLDRVLLHAVLRPRRIGVHADRGLASVQGAELTPDRGDTMVMTASARSILLAVLMSASAPAALAQTPE